MADNLNLTQEALHSFRNEQDQWKVVIAGLRLAAIGVAIAGGITLTLLAPVVATFLPASIISVLVAIGSLCGVAGMIAWLLGLAKCLVVPHQGSRIVLLTGLVVAAYGLADTMSRMTLYMRQLERLNARQNVVTRERSQDLFDQIFGNFSSTLLPGVIYSIVANILISVFLLSLATYIRDKVASRKIHELWIFQFGGTIVLFALTLSMPFLSDLVSYPVVGAMISLVLSIAQFAVTLFLSFRVFWFIASELEKKVEQVKLVEG